MKARYIIYIFVLLSILATAIFVVILPSEVPAHYNSAGELDRTGSKYEYLLFPLLNILMGSFFVLLNRYFKKRGEKGNQLVVLVSGACVSVLFFAMTLFFLFSAYYYVSPTVREETLNTDLLYRFTAIALGAVFIVLGCFMPKTTLNSIAGLRTSWSMKNERVWQKSQKTGGIIMISGGAAELLTGIISGDLLCFILSMAVFALIFAAAVISSYIVYKKDKKAYPDDYPV